MPRTQRGASRGGFATKQQTVGLRWSYVFSSLLLLAMLAALINLAREPLIELVDRPVSQVVVEGDFRFVDENAIRELVLPEIDRSFLQLDLAKIKARVEAQPWVKQVVLSRQWPDRLQVVVYEHTPIARWNENGFLSVEGRPVVARDAAQLLRALPKLNGPSERALEIMTSYRRLSQLLSEQNLQLVELTLDQRRNWALQLNNGWQLEIGREQVFERVQRFARIYQRVLKNKPQIKKIDLRYQNGFAVSWQP